LLSSKILSTCSHNMVNFGPLAAEIGPVVWGTPGNFSRCRILASLLQRRRSTEANQTLHDVWPSPELVRYIYIFRILALQRNFVTCKIHFASNSCVLLYWQRYCTTLEQIGVSGSLRCRTRNGIAELSQRAASIFGRLGGRWESAHIIHSEP